MISGSKCLIFLFVFQFRNFTLSPDGQVMTTVLMDAKYSMRVIRLEKVLKSQVFAFKDIYGNEIVNIKICMKSNRIQALTNPLKFWKKRLIIYAHVMY